MTDTDDAPLSPEEQARHQADLDAAALFRKLRTWFRADREASSEWRAEAREDFEAFHAVVETWGRSGQMINYEPYKAPRAQQ